MDYKKIELLLKYAEQMDLTSFDLGNEEIKAKAAYEIVEKELGIDVKVLKNIAPAKDPNKALIILIQDITGSIGLWEKNVSREYFELAEQEIQNKYSHGNTKFIGFHTSAIEFKSLDEIYKTANCGGTIVSSGLEKAKEIILKNLDKNIYIFFISDGDNLSSNNARSVNIIEEILQFTNYFQYVELNQYNRNSTLMNAFKNIRGKKNFGVLTIKQKDEALKGIRFKEVLEKEGK